MSYFSNVHAKGSIVLYSLLIMNTMILECCNFSLLLIILTFALPVSNGLLLLFFKLHVHKTMKASFSFLQGSDKIIHPGFPSWNCFEDISHIFTNNINANVQI